VPPAHTPGVPPSRVASPFAIAGGAPLDDRKFRDPGQTTDGKLRASVTLRRLETLWVNTGTLCNLSCTNCYIESSPFNDRLAYFRLDDLRAYLDEASARDLRTIGFTGGEPFMNPDIIALLDAALASGRNVLVLTNAMRPMQRHKAALSSLHARYGKALALRVSLDHFTPELHDAERGNGAWQKAIEGLGWLAGNGFQISVAGRMPPDQPEATVRDGFQALFDRIGLGIDAQDRGRLVIFAEMDAGADVPEIGEECWDVLGRHPDQMMCSSSRMVVRRKGADAPSVIACTLLPDAAEFDLGATLDAAGQRVALNHPHCARFCVLGGSSCAGS
jgi:Radical SAM superfamily/4Fe-4S single cluster domain